MVDFPDNSRFDSAGVFPNRDIRVGHTIIDLAAARMPTPSVTQTSLAPEFHRAYIKSSPALEEIDLRAEFAGQLSRLIISGEYDFSSLHFEAFWSKIENLFRDVVEGATYQANERIDMQRALLRKIFERDYEALKGQFFDLVENPRENLKKLHPPRNLDYSSFTGDIEFEFTPVAIVATLDRQDLIDSGYLREGVAGVEIGRESYTNRLNGSLIFVARSTVNNDGRIITQLNTTRAHELLHAIHGNLFDFAPRGENSSLEHVFLELNELPSNERLNELAKLLYQKFMNSAWTECISYLSHDEFPVSVGNLGQDSFLRALEYLREEIWNLEVSAVERRRLYTPFKESYTQYLLGIRECQLFIEWARPFADEAHPLQPEKFTGLLLVLGHENRRRLFEFYNREPENEISTIASRLKEAGAKFSAIASSAERTRAAGTRAGYYQFLADHHCQELCARMDLSYPAESIPGLLWLLQGAHDDYGANWFLETLERSICANPDELPKYKDRIVNHLEWFIYCNKTDPDFSTSLALAAKLVSQIKTGKDELDEVPLWVQVDDLISEINLEGLTLERIEKALNLIPIHQWQYYERDLVTPEWFDLVHNTASFHLAGSLAEHCTSPSLKLYALNFLEMMTATTPCSQDEEARLRSLANNLLYHRWPPDIDEALLYGIETATSNILRALDNVSDKQRNLEFEVDGELETAPHN